MTSLSNIPVIIDTDPGVDDALAILLALASPELEILGFVVSFGNTDLYSSYVNIYKVYQAASRHVEQHPEDKGRFPNLFSPTKPFIAYGAHEPTVGIHHNARYFHGSDGLSEITERHPDLDFQLKDGLPCHPQLRPTDRPGVEVAIESIRSQPERAVSYIVLGPLTNLAQALRLDASAIRDRLGRVICMGGVLDVPGNTTPVAEFNFFADPYAVKEILVPTDHETSFPLERFVLLPLDITTPHELSFPFYKQNVDPSLESAAVPSNANGKKPIVHFTSSFFERTRDIMCGFGKDAMELHDIVAVWCAIENPPARVEQGGLPLLQAGWKAVQRKFDVERIGEVTRGMLVVDRREDERTYAPGANRAEVQAELERQRFDPSTFESTALPAEVEIEQPGQSDTSRGGVPCIIETPGPSMLVKLLLERVWGIV